MISDLTQDLLDALRRKGICDNPESASYRDIQINEDVSIDWMNDVVEVTYWAEENEAFVHMGEHIGRRYASREKWIESIMRDVGNAKQMARMFKTNKAS